MQLRATLLASLALASIVGCTDAKDDPKLTANDAARAQFTEQMGANYQFTWKYGCFCPDEYVRPTRVTVHAGAIVSMVDVETNAAVDGAQRGNITTIDGVFDLIEQEQATAEVVTVTYDPTTGVPTFLGVDAIVAAEDDGFALHISDVVVQ